jgi:hypothetical protein
MPTHTGTAVQRQGSIGGIHPSIQGHTRLVAGCWQIRHPGPREPLSQALWQRPAATRPTSPGLSRQVFAHARPERRSARPSRRTRPERRPTSGRSRAGGPPPPPGGRRSTDLFNAPEQVAPAATSIAPLLANSESDSTVTCGATPKPNRAMIHVNFPGRACQANRREL